MPSVSRGTGTELFRPEGSAGLFMCVDECGIWLVSDCGGGIFLRLYDEAGAVLAEMELPAAPRSLLLFRRPCLG